MERKSFLKGISIGFILCAIALLTLTAFKGRYENIDQKLVAIDNTLQKYFIGKIDQTKMEDGIYRGFVNGVGDPYTTYYTREEYESFKEKSSGVYVGIGVQMSIDSSDNTIIVTNVLKNSAAEEVGILKGDKIVGAEGKKLTGDDFNEAPKIIKGKEGTPVEVDVYRPSEDKNYHLKMIRKSVSYPTVEHQMIGKDLGYIKITQFEEITYDQFKEALNQLTKKQAKGLIIDVRNNPGGLLHITTQIADEFLSEGVIVSTKDKKGDIRKLEADENATDIPLVILVNQDSASASEVLSGAIKDHKRGILVGTTTFGKGIVQSLLPFPDGSALKVTTSQYFTPSNVCIQGVGIEPDYYVDLPDELMLKADLTMEEDTQLQKAVQVLKDQIK